MSEIAHIPQLRFPEFNGEWEEKALGVVATITTGSTPSTSNNEYYDGDVAFVSPADIQGNRIVRSTKTTITELGLSVVREIKKRSTLFVCIGSTIGKVSQAGVNCATNQQINALTAKNSFDNDFIYSLLEFKAPRIKLLAGVQAVPQINKSEFSRFKFTFPLLPEQQKIAAFLTAVDNKIEQLSKKQELLGEYKKGLMQQIFSQVIRFKAGDTPGQPLLPNGNSPSGSDFPNWEEKRLGDLCEITTGKLDANAMVEGGQYRFYTCAKEYYKIDDYAFDTDALIVSGNGANVGYIHHYQGKFNAYQRTYVLDSFTDNIIFVKFVLDEYLHKRIMKEKNEGNTPYIVMGTLTDMKINLPSFSEQTKIAIFLSSIDSKIEQVGKQLDESKQFKKALLQQMFV